MSRHLVGRRTAAALLAGAALFAGALSLASHHGAQQSVADSSWGGIAPSSPSPSPSPSDPLLATTNDSSWGG